MAVTKKQLENVTGLFKLLADPTRFKIVTLLLDARDKELCVHEIASAIGMSHSATSHQLAKLEASGVLTSYRTGQTVCYVLDRSERARDAQKAIASLNA